MEISQRQACDKDFLTRPLFRHLVAHGHVIMDVAYSLAPEADLDCMLGDVKQAILWLKQHCVEYGVAPDRIVLMGVSGGVHLALLAAHCCCFTCSAARSARYPKLIDQARPSRMSARIVRPR